MESRDHINNLYKEFPLHSDKKCHLSFGHTRLAQWDQQGPSFSLIDYLFTTFIFVVIWLLLSLLYFCHSWLIKN